MKQLNGYWHNLNIQLCPILKREVYEYQTLTIIGRIYEIAFFNVINYF